MSGDNTPVIERWSSAVQATAAALLTISAGTGAVCYFVGAHYQEQFAHLVGFTRPPGDESLQWTVSQGARILMGGDNAGLFAALFGVLTLFCLIGYAFPQYRRFRQLMFIKNKAAAAKVKRDRAAGGSRRRNPFPSALVFGTISALFGCTFLIGDTLVGAAQIAAFKHFVVVGEDLHGTCKDCNAYKFDNRFIVGHPLFQSEKMIYVQDRFGTIHPIDLEKLNSIEFFRPKDHSIRLEVQSRVRNRNGCGGV
jgi:hypothetical protein